jgi:hypothetical protein
MGTERAGCESGRRLTSGETASGAGVVVGGGASGGVAWGGGGRSDREAGIVERSPLALVLEGGWGEGETEGVVLVLLGVPQQLTQLAGTWRVGPARVADRWDRIVESVGSTEASLRAGYNENLCAHAVCVHGVSLEV